MTKIIKKIKTIKIKMKLTQRQRELIVKDNQRIINNLKRNLHIRDSDKQIIKEYYEKYNQSILSIPDSGEGEIILKVELPQGTLLASISN